MQCINYWNQKPSYPVAHIPCRVWRNLSCDGYLSRLQKNHLTMLKTRKQVLSVNTAEEWLLTENSVPVSVCYPLSLCMCVIWSPLNTPMALSVSQMEIEEEKLRNMGSSVRTFPSHLSHTQWKREKTEPGAVSMCSDVPWVCHECVCVCVWERWNVRASVFMIYDHTLTNTSIEDQGHDI